MASPSSEKLICSALLSFGSSLGLENILLDYDEASTTTGNIKSLISKEFAASATDQSVDLSQYVDTATFIGIRDRNNTGVLVGRTAGTSARHHVAANGLFLYKNGATTPPTLYFDNPSSTEKALVDIIILGSSS